MLCSVALLSWWHKIEFTNLIAYNWAKEHEKQECFSSYTHLRKKSQSLFARSTRGRCTLSWAQSRPPSSRRSKQLTTEVCVCVEHGSLHTSTRGEGEEELEGGKWRERRTMLTCLLDTFQTYCALTLLDERLSRPATTDLFRLQLVPCAYSPLLGGSLLKTRVQCVLEAFMH